MAKSPAFQWYPRDILSSQRIKEFPIWHLGKGRIEDKTVFKYVKFKGGFTLWAKDDKLIAEGIRDINTMDDVAQKWLEKERELEAENEKYKN